MKIYIRTDNIGNIEYASTDPIDDTIEIDYDNYEYLMMNLSSAHYNSATDNLSINVEDSRSSKIIAIDALTITTTSGKVFDGDEASQDRMVRAIQIAGITGQTTTTWKMADNSIVEVTLDELKEALALAGQAMSEIWLA